MSSKLPTLKTTRLLLFAEVKPCDNRVTEKPSTFSRARLCVVAPRPGLEPGTYGLTDNSYIKLCLFNGGCKLKINHV
jgi:hypothetical protein